MKLNFQSELVRGSLGKGDLLDYKDTAIRLVIAAALKCGQKPSKSIGLYILPELVHRLAARTATRDADSSAASLVRRRPPWKRRKKRQPDALLVNK